MPTDREAAFWRAGRLAAQLARGPYDYDLVLVGLLDALGVLILLTAVSVATVVYFAHARRGERRRSPQHLLLVGRVTNAAHHPPATGDPIKGVFR